MQPERHMQDARDTNLVKPRRMKKTNVPPCTMNQTVISTVIEVILKVPLEYLAKTDSVDQGRVVQ